MRGVLRFGPDSAPREQLPWSWPHRGADCFPTALLSHLCRSGDRALLGDQPDFPALLLPVQGQSSSCLQCTWFSSAHAGGPRGPGALSKHSDFLLSIRLAPCSDSHSPVSSGSTSPTVSLLAFLLPRPPLSSPRVSHHLRYQAAVGEPHLQTLSVGCCVQLVGSAGCHALGEAIIPSYPIYSFVSVTPVPSIWLLTTQHSFSQPLGLHALLTWAWEEVGLSRPPRPLSSGIPCAPFICVCKSAITLLASPLACNGLARFQQRPAHAFQPPF